MDGSDDPALLAHLGIEAALLAAVEIGELVMTLDDEPADRLDQTMYLSTSSAVLLACAGPHLRSCLDRLLTLGVLAWDELGELDARRGLSDGFDADQRRVFALVSKTRPEDIDTLGDRVSERLGGQPTAVLSTTLMVVTRMLWGVARATGTDAQGALDAVRRMPEDDGAGP